MLVAGVPAAIVARQLGHSSPAVTTTVYEHLLDDGLLDVALDVLARVHRERHSGQSSCASGTPSERPCASASARPVTSPRA